MNEIDNYNFLGAGYFFKNSMFFKIFYKILILYNLKHSSFKVFDASSILNR